MVADSTVVVVGSIHLDLQIEVPHLPRPGETVLGANYLRAPGGKGANQAVATAVTGQRATLIGRVGNDQDGLMARAGLARHGVDLGYVSTDAEEPTGVALILVDRSGTNQIAVSPGASGCLSVADVARGAEVIAEARVVLVQLEVPLESVQAAIDRAGDNAIVVLNAAPARELPTEILRRIDVLVLNLVELRHLSGISDLDSLSKIADACRVIPECPSVVVTLGSNGALLVAGDETSHVRGESVEAIDTTGAGDAFCGALASALAAGNPLTVAVKEANSFAAASTMRRGALPSFFGNDELGDPLPLPHGGEG